MLGLKDETRLSSPEELPFKVLTEIGSIASIVGLPLSLIALGFAIYHLMNLRGETRAAREAAEEAQRLIKRETTGTDLTRLNARIQGLIDLLRTNDRERALERFPEIRNLFIDIRRHHPNLTPEHRSQIQESIASLGRMQSELEASSSGIQTDLTQIHREGVIWAL
jgi:hypothetical protein